MVNRDSSPEPAHHARCCPCSDHSAPSAKGVTRRTFMAGVGGAALGGMMFTGLAWPALAAAGEDALPLPPLPRALKVKPILVYSTPTRRHQSSWRSWGGIETEQHASEEIARIGKELSDLERQADFPVDFLPIARVKSASDLTAIGDLAAADTVLVYAAGGWMDVFNALGELGKDVILFVRHKSGPVYLWYEIISPRYLRQHTDELKVKNIDDGDVIVDSQDEILWRLRALGGLKNARGTKILAIGGAAGWAQPAGVVPALAEKTFQLDIESVPYEELGRLINEARAHGPTVELARTRAAAYLEAPGVTLETDRSFVENAFLLEQVFRGLMHKAGCGAITINGCMGTIMPKAETSACLTLSLLNDAGYLAFCESDFVVIPSGILLAAISGKPVFLNDPTYPHDGIITLAHCTAPRRMDGKRLEPARILTHFESDYGAAPKVEMGRGKVVTNIIPDFAFKRWVGLKGVIEEAPFLPICRSQIDISFTCDSHRLAERMPGFHWMTGYGDYCAEVGYALKRTRIAWEMLS